MLCGCSRVGVRGSVETKTLCEESKQELSNQNPIQMALRAAGGRIRHFRYEFQHFACKQIVVNLSEHKILPVKRRFEQSAILDIFGFGEAPGVNGWFWPADGCPIAAKCQKNHFFVANFSEFGFIVHSQP